jgi:hypothetical protein
MKNRMKLFKQKNKIQIFNVINGDLDHAYLEDFVIYIIESLRRIAPRNMEMAGDYLSAAHLANYVNKEILYPVGEEVQTGPNY